MPPPAPAWRQKQASCCRVRVRRDISRCIRIKTRRACGSRRLRPSQCRARGGVRVLVGRAAMRWVPSELIDRLMNNQWYALVSTISHMRIHTLSPAHTPSRDACDGALVRGRACRHRRPPSCSPVPPDPTLYQLPSSPMASQVLLGAFPTSYTRTAQQARRAARPVEGPQSRRTPASLPSTRTPQACAWPGPSPNREVRERASRSSPITRRTSSSWR